MKERRRGPLPRRFRWARTMLRVLDRFDEVHGGYLASSVTLAAFTSMFPLLLVAVGIIGYLSLSTDIAAQIIGHLGLTGEAADAVLQAINTAQASRKGAIGLGTIGLLWSGLGLVAALQYAFDNVWQVKGRGLKDKLVGFGWLVGATLIMLASFGATALLNLEPWLAPVSILVGL